MPPKKKDPETIIIEINKEIARANENRSLSTDDKSKQLNRLYSRRSYYSNMLKPNQKRKRGPKGKIKPGLTGAQSDRFRELDNIRRSSNRTITPKEKKELLVLNRAYDKALEAAAASSSRT